MFSKIVKPYGNGSIIIISITPSSKKLDLISGTDEWRGALKVRVAQPPVGGKANRELIEGFSGFFNAAVRILSGSTARQKLLYIPLPPEEVVEKLENASKPPEKEGTALKTANSPEKGKNTGNARKRPDGTGNSENSGKSAAKGGW